MLGSKKKQAPGTPTIRDPLAVIPLIPPTVEMRRDNRGLTHVRQTVPVNRLRKKLAKVFGFDYSRTIELDDRGTLYFSLVDGKHTIREIIDGMTATLGRDPKEMEASVLQFTKKLMTLQMIVLQVTPSSQGKKTS